MFPLNDIVSNLIALQMSGGGEKYENKDKHIIFNGTFTPENNERWKNVIVNVPQNSAGLSDIINKIQSLPSIGEYTLPSSNGLYILYKFGENFDDVLLNNRATYRYTRIGNIGGEYTQEISGINENKTVYMCFYYQDSFLYAVTAFGSNYARYYWHYGVKNENNKFILSNAKTYEDVRIPRHVEILSMRKTNSWDMPVELSVTLTYTTQLIERDFDGRETSNKSNTLYPPTASTTCH